MITYRKIFDSEWWYRKCMIILRRLISKEWAEEIHYQHLVKIVYKLELGRKLHLHNPKRLNEKLVWLSLFWKHPDKARCADKFKMREYAIDKGLPADILVPLIGTYSSTEEIDFSSLPERYVLKCNHGCGYNIIVKDKSSLNYDSVTNLINSWLSEFYGGGITELHYRDILPRLILCESYLPSLDSSSIIDYKIHCINGTPIFVLVCYDRDENGIAKLASFDFGWKQLFYCKDEETVQIRKPESLHKILAYSQILSEDFPFVRVDFYDVNGHPYLGELTFTPLGNMINYFTDNVQINLGKMLKLPPKSVCSSTY